MKQYKFEEFNLIEFDLIQIDNFTVHDSCLEEWRVPNRKDDLYIRNAEWCIQKWYWFPRIIEETVNEPVLRDLMLHIPNFYEEIDVIRLFVERIDIDGESDIRRRQLRPREFKINSLNLKYMFYSKPKKHPILVAKAVYMFSFLKNALVNGWNECGEYHSACFVIGINVKECFKRNYNYGYESFLKSSEKKLLKLQEPMREEEEIDYFNDLGARILDVREEYKYILKLINLKYWLNRKGEYLKHVLQHNKRLFNLIIFSKNPDFMSIDFNEGKWFLEISKIRTKWCCEERIWINKARRYSRNWLGYKFNLDKFYDLIIKLHSKFRKDTN
jgi:hypothetical protein